jgi:alpha-2-macroglobulin
MKKGLTIGIIILIIAAIFIYIFTDILKTKQSSKTIKPSYNQYVYFHTSGMISKKSTIRVQFTKDIIEQEQVGEESKSKIIDFQPSIKGSATWIDRKTIEFKPNVDLKSGTVYACHVFVSDLFNEVAVEDFEFSFEVIKQSFDIVTDELVTTDKKALKYQKLTGTIITADYENTNTVKEILKADYNAQNIYIKWTENFDTKNHVFSIDSIQREDDEGILKLEWNGDAINSDKKGNLILEIPALGDFKFVGSKISHGDEQFVQISFSDPIKVNQDLRGLIQIKGISNLDFVVEENSIKVFPPSRLRGSYTIKINEGIKNIIDYKLKESAEINITFEKIKPAVRMVSQGTILPSSTDGIVLPFECVNLKAIDVQVVKIYENNILQFLQANNYQGSYQLHRVGKPIVQKTIQLDKSNVVDLGSWNRFTLDLNDLIQTEPGALYQVKIGFRKKHSTYNCSNSDDEESSEENPQDNWEIEEEEEASFWDNFENYYYSSGYYSWEHRDDPCHNAYYGARQSVSQNILASNIGLIVKRGKNDSIQTFITDIRTTDPIQNATIKVFDYQQQLISKENTNKEGVAYLAGNDKAYFIIAEYNEERAYIKLADGESLSLSMFDVSGTNVKKGMKGFIYGDRGVWRPGDSIFVSFMLEENNIALPDNHPIIFELRDPNSKLTHKLVQNKNKHNLYVFKIKTKIDAPTGNWFGTMKVGSNKFSKVFKIETIKPNRLKINFDLTDKYITRNQTLSTKINVKWLHGAIAKNLQTKIDLVLNPKSISFSKYGDYSFNDPSKSFSTEKTTIFEEQLDENGEVLFETELSTGSNAPGMLKATFMTKVFEKSGNFSIDQFSLPYHPYDNYVGIKSPKGDKRGMLLTDTTHKIEILLVDHEGNILNDNHTVDMEFYKLEWRWWWDNSYDNVANYVNRSYNSPLKEDRVITENGKATWNIRINYPDWGRYLVRAYDRESGHSCSKIVYIDWPGWAGKSRGEGQGAAMLTFTTDKKKYDVGEEVNLTIPTSVGGRALVSIENGSKIVQNHWVITQDKETKFKFVTTKEMSPNVYVNVTLLQPHAQTANDLPLRMYGIVPISVQNPESHINPVLTMPDDLESETTVNIEVKEENGKPMVYTVAVIDEGLLDITRFKTPDPWNSFYAKEAIGVKSWDIYDDVIGSFGGTIERLLNIGGGEDAEAAPSQKANRFKPMVRFMGPYTLNSGETNSHSVEIPRYIGSVKTMVIARYEKAYGTTDKATPVKKPLMVLGTLPRVLGPGETTTLPVNIFVMDENINNVNLEIKTNDILSIEGDKKQQLRFLEIGEKMAYFNLKVKSELGIGKVEIIATSGKHKAIYDIELDVRNPNPYVTDVSSKVINKGEKWSTSFNPVGIKGTNSGFIELSSIPPINLSSRLKYLIRYPHGCIEQTTSSVFPQLFLNDILEINQKQKDDIEKNIKAGIQRLQSFQLSNGGFSYWPGSSDANIWGSNYAGHFLLEAKQKGYSIPSGLMRNWIKFQKRKANNWTDDGNRSQLIQAYRLYTLALAQKAEIGAMNRLHEKTNLTNEAKWRLAAAYKIIGKDRIANLLVENLTSEVQEYTELGYTYGSGLRDIALIMETMILMNQKEKAFDLLIKISEKLNSEKWYSTQTTAFCFIAVSKYLSNAKLGEGINIAYNINNGKEYTIKSNNFITQSELDIEFTISKTIDIANNGNELVYAKIISIGQPEIGDNKDASNNLDMKISYYTTEGESLDPIKIKQGTDFVAEIYIQHVGLINKYENLALSQVLPSGWEIINTRLNDTEIFGNTDPFTYQDIRDDRVYTYFDLTKNKSKTYKVLLNASYPGRYYLPTTYCEAMYDNEINAKRHGMWVEVVK